MNSNKKNLSGFSLFEILVTLGILLMITAVVFPVTLQKSQKSKLESYASQLVTDLYYQQQRSARRGTAEGIDIDSNGYTMFDGISELDATETQTKTYPANIWIEAISLTTGDEILFPAGEFKPSVYGSVNITDGRSSMRVSINREGLIEYENL